MRTQQIICIDGIIGAGKSTIVKRLRDSFTCFEEPIEEWTLLGNLYSDPKIFATPFQFQVLFSQHHQFNKFKNIKDTVVVERCPWTSKNIFAEMLIEQGYFDTNALQTYNEFHSNLSFNVDHLIFLDISPEIAWKRICSRDRHAERNLTKDYLHALNNKYHEVLSSEREKPKITIIDANKTADEVETEVRKIAQKLKI